MRLTCPNCDAQYEIEASLIPPTGRDVQCSNCGKTWFQPPEGGLAEEPLVVEARVNTADIEKLYIGQPSRVRLSAFDQGDVPEAQGRIIDISADSLEDDRTGQFHYLARIRLDQTQTDDIAALELVPGMPAAIFINTGERTALSYLAQPLSERLARTFIE